MEHPTHDLIILDNDIAVGPIGHHLFKTTDFAHLLTLEKT